MDYFEQRLRRKLRNPDFAAGYHEAIRESQEFMLASPSFSLVAPMTVYSEAEVAVTWSQSPSQSEGQLLSAAS